MQPMIQPSSALRNNYNDISQLCREQRQPVFLTKNGHGDTVIMDLDTYGRREKELDAAQRLIDAQRARLAGVQGYSVDEFAEGMRIAIDQGVKLQGAVALDGGA
ncbi:MAG: type II toxin-antitoxin system Phd/YefM family antitoxin [Coriobacteriia bacterium]|nr:type II toxin-antitoxin system Phd/YefM family antitoxin [Coriobacteriia bacterium]